MVDSAVPAIMAKGFDCAELGSGQTKIFFAIRLDDRAALCSTLSLARHCSDAALVSAAWRKWGPGVTDHLLGDFAIVVHDRSAGHIWALRDHIGARPLFWRSSTKGYAFSGSIEPLLRDGENPPLDDVHLAAAMLGGHRCAPESTFYRDIRRIPPGHGLHIKPDGSIKTHRWWKPFERAQLGDSSVHALLEEGRELLCRSVHDRLCHDATIGFHLSGGLDSSAILALAVPQLAEFGSSGFGFAWQQPGDAGEGARIRTAANLAGFAFEVPATEVDRIVRLLRKDWAKGPNQWNLLHEDAVQDAASSRGIGTIFSGWGGDEAISFNGRGLHAEYLASLQLAKLSGITRDRSIRAFGSAFRVGWRQMRHQAKPDAAGRPHTYLAADFLASVPILPKRQVDLRSGRAAMQTLLALGTISERVEDWAISGRSKGLDYLYPLLDRRMMEFAYRLPSSVFRKGGIKRWFFREMMRDQLPEQIRTEQSKHEPQRTGDLALQLSAAFRALAEELQDRASTMARAQYFDMGALIADLRDPPKVGDPRLGDLRRAVQFLDF